MFSVDQKLIDKARALLFEQPNIYWVVGGACTGKSTICRAVCESSGATPYDMDAHVFGHYMSRYSADRHPASKAWFSATKPLAWVLSLSDEDFAALNRAANAEYLDLLADDLEHRDRRQPVLIDGGITHPAIIAQAIPPERIFCLELPAGEAARMWETSPSRLEMKRSILALPNYEQKWARFLSFDQQISRTIGTECREASIKIFERNGSTTVSELAVMVASHFGL